MTLVLAAVEASADQLRDVLERRDRLLSRREAIARVAASDLADREPLLRSVLENRQEHPLDRGIAAAGLAAVGTASALAAIAREARGSGAAVLVPAVQIMGRAGGAEERRVLDDIARTPDAWVAEQARFAAALISYRHHLDLPGLPLIGSEFLEMPDSDTAAIDVTRADPEETAMCHASLRAERLAFETAPDAAYRLQCRKRTMILSVDPRFLDSTGVKELTRRKALVAVVATRVEDGTRYSASHVVLADPTRGGRFLLRVFRMSGVLVLSGDAIVSDRASFDLRAIRRPSAMAVELAGTFGEEGLNILTARAARHVHRIITPLPTRD